MPVATAQIAQYSPGSFVGWSGTGISKCLYTSCAGGEGPFTCGDGVESKGCCAVSRREDRKVGAMR